ncbi:MAG: hypothetical protein K0R49_1480, partial [Burkholderiales bacterium]|nr:hypothetical protein [Burkholderiales bacterium]
EDVIKDYVHTNTNTFLEMQERLQKQTANIFNYMQFPFKMTDKK